MSEARTRGRPVGTKSKPREFNTEAVIRTGVVYPKPVFLGIVGWGEAGLLDAIRDGLRVVYIGGKSSIVGDDYLAFMRSPDRKTRGTSECRQERSVSMSSPVKDGTSS